VSSLGSIPARLLIDEPVRRHGAATRPTSRNERLPALERGRLYRLSRLSGGDGDCFARRRRCRVRHRRATRQRAGYSPSSDP